MNVCFFACGEEYADEAEMAAEALRLTNPHAKIYCLTDQDTQFKTLEPVRGQYSKSTLMYDRIVGQAHFLRDNRQALFLDSDCLVGQDLTNAFKGPISVTKRIPPKQTPGQIYNCGVLFGSGAQAISFWLHWIDVFQFLERNAWKWYGDQIILAHLVGDYPSVNIYESETHNYIPTHLDSLDSVLPAKIVHFKGLKRKAWIPYYLDTLRKHYGAQDLRRSA